MLATAYLVISPSQAAFAARYLAADLPLLFGRSRKRLLQDVARIAHRVWEVATEVAIEIGVRRDRLACRRLLSLSIWPDTSRSHEYDFDS